jgi:hypothetical protein
MMLQKITMLTGVLAIAAMALMAFAPSVHAEDPAPERDNTFLRGRGVLDAQGDGLVAVKGKMDLYVRAERGVLLVRDIAGNAAVRVDGDGRTASWNGFTVYFGFNGDAHVTGTDVAVIVVGQDIDLHVVGAGWAYLKGEGTFEVNNRGPFRWTPEGAFASVVNDALE